MTHTHKRELTHRFRPIWRIEGNTNLLERCEDLLRRMHSIWHKTQGGVFVFADDEGYVFLVPTENPACDRVALQENRYFVGAYGMRVLHPVEDAYVLFPTAEQLREDLIAHFCSIDYITEKMIRDAIVDAEG